jgi:hypothetical protein
VVEWDGLENRCALTRTVGSNPTPSASFRSNTCQYDSFMHISLSGIKPEYLKRILIINSL